jgi:hypothetical protein
LIPRVFSSEKFHSTIYFVFSPSKALAFFITNMDSVVNKPYILIYFNTETQVENVYDSAFYKLLYDSLDQRYLNNLRGLYLVHTNLMLKVSTQRISQQGTLL